MSCLEHAEIKEHILTRSREEVIIFIIDEYGEQIKRLIFTYVKNYAQTDDLFQEFLMTVYSSIDQFKGKSSFLTWLYRIAINKCKDYLRSPIHRFFPIKDDIALSRSVDSTEQIVLEKERYEHIVRCMLSLPIKYREIIVLRFHHGFSIKEISEALNIGESTVKTRIMRGKEKLQKKLGGDFFEEF